MDKELLEAEQDRLEHVRQRVCEGFYLRKDVATVIAEKLMKKFLAKKVKP